MSSIAYRRDIDGLRAIAVISVILFHADIGIFSGGFVGVDVFFVISGFLISSIILKESQQGNFSLIRFYERRLRRIFPALFFMLLCVTLVASFLLLPPDLKDYGQSVSATTLSVANVFFWWETGYFESHSAFKPLLHAWSLGVEEQFYIFFPVFVAALFLFQLQKRLIFICTVLFLGSLAASVLLTPSYPEFSFFLPFTRAWQLLLGTFLALNIFPGMSNKILRHVLSFIGGVCILGSVLFFSEKTVFPGLSALIPSIGAALLIYSGMHGQGFLNKAMSTRPLVITGLISYSLYLWHWPLFALLRYYRYEPLNYTEIGAVIVLSFLIAFLSWKYVEKPFRGQDSRISNRALFIGSFAAILVSFSIGVVFHIAQGLPQRFDESVARALHAKHQNNPLHSNCLLEGQSDALPAETPCIFGDLSKPYTFVIWGDSQADHLVPGLDYYARKSNLSGRQITKAGCPPLIGALKVDSKNLPRHDCRRFNEHALDFIVSSDRIKTVILSARWALYAENNVIGIGAGPNNNHYLIDDVSTVHNRKNSKRVFSTSLSMTIERLSQSGKQIIISGQTPELSFNVPDCLARAQAGFFPTKTCQKSLFSDIKKRSQFVHDAFDSIRRQHENIALVMPERLLCDDLSCALETSVGPVYSDDNHLSVEGSKVVTRYMGQLWSY